MRYLQCVFAVLFIASSQAQPLNIPDSAKQSFFNWNHEALVRFKEANGIEGLAYAFFDNQKVIWQECLGNSTYGFQINDQTLFSIQSISKNITALAVMFAVKDGLLDLDTPISKYLPEFTVNSCFEEKPEQKMTLRHLLTHTAGFTHEAPLGNNYDYSPCSFDEHLKTIKDTWLRFPVGTRYSYSNLGMDVAAQVVQRVSGLASNDYLKSKIFRPLRMASTTIDDGEVVANKNRTEGSPARIKTQHYQIPLIGSGAVYTNLSDFIKYAQLHSEVPRHPPSPRLSCMSVMAGPT